MDEILQFKLKFLKKTAENLVVNEVTSDLSLGVFADNQILFSFTIAQEVQPSRLIGRCGASSADGDAPGYSDGAVQALHRS